MPRKRPSPATGAPPLLPSTRGNLLWIFLGLGLVGAVYALLFLRYRPEDLDDAWSLSYIFQYWKFGRETDPIFGGPARIMYFGKVQALLTGLLLNPLGWTRGAAHALSILWMVLSSGLWALILRRLGHDRVFIAVFCVLTLLLEPFFSSAHSARPEAFVYFLVSLCLWFWTKGDGFTAALAAGLAIETHPMGVMAFVAMAAAFFHPALRARLLANRKGVLLGIGAGLALSAAGYLLLHPQAFSTLGREIAEGNTQGGRAMNNYLFDYYFKTRYFRHLPELAMLLAAVWVFVRRGLWKKEPFIAAYAALALASTFVLSRPNYHYALYVYPAFLLLILYAAQALGWIRFAPAVFLLLLLPQYGAVYAKNRSFHWQENLEKIRALVPDDSLKVLGSANEWFAFQDRKFIWSQYVGDKNALDFKEAYLVEENDYRTSPGSLKPWVERTFRSDTAGAVTLGGESYRLLRLRRLP